MHRIRSTHVVLTLLSWERAAAVTHPARTAWITGTISFAPQAASGASNALLLRKSSWPVGLCSHPPFHKCSLHPVSLLHAPNTSTHLLPKCCFSAFSTKGSVWEPCTFPGFAQGQLTAYFKTVFSQCGVGFWRGLYDLAVEMPLPSHLLKYLLPPREPALLWMVLPLQSLT